jgi:hypothetical protein
MSRAVYWIIVPILFGAAFGVATVVVRDTDGKVELAVMALGLVLGTQVELTRRLLKRAERHDQAGRIIAQVEELPEALAKTVRANLALLTVAADAGHNDLIFDRALKARLDEQRTWLQRFNSGVIEVESDEAGQLADWTAGAKQSIKATMIARTDVYWWQSRPGIELWQANLKALRRRVRVQRVFIYARMTPELSSLIREQLAAGVEAYVVAVDQLRPGLDVDLTIIDDVRVHDVQFSAGGNAMAYRYSQEPDRAIALRAKFEQILQAATPAQHFEFPD